MTTLTITPQQILDDRQMRRDAGLAGCITGKPEPELDFFGYNDVQIWNKDANGNLNGDPGFNPKDPGCLCFDCRGAFDSTGEVDAELVNAGHANACYTYRNLVPDRPLPAQQANPQSPPPGGDHGEVNDAQESTELSTNPPRVSNP